MWIKPVEKNPRRARAGLSVSLNIIERKMVISTAICIFFFFYAVCVFVSTRYFSNKSKDPWIYSKHIQFNALSFAPSVVRAHQLISVKVFWCTSLSKTIAVKTRLGLIRRIYLNICFYLLLVYMVSYFNVVQVISSEFLKSDSPNKLIPLSLRSNDFCVKHFSFVKSVGKNIFRLILYIFSRLYLRYRSHNYIRAFGSSADIKFALNHLASALFCFIAKNTNRARDLLIQLCSWFLRHSLWLPPLKSAPCVCHFTYSLYELLLRSTDCDERIASFRYDGREMDFIALRFD